MKKFTIMLMAAFIAVVSYAQVPSAKAMRALPVYHSLKSGKNLKNGISNTASRHMARLAPFKTNGAVMRAESQTEVVTPPAGITESLYTMYTVACYSEDYEALSLTVTLAFDGNDVYIQGLCPYLPEAWVKGSVEEGKMTIPTGQYFGLYAGKYPMYILGGHQEQIAEDDPETEDVDESDYELVIEDLVFDIDEETGIISNNSNQYLFINGQPDALGFYDFFFAPDFTPIICEPITAPADLVTEIYTMSGIDSRQGAYSKKVNVGFDGNDVYIQGINDYLPEAWVKGTIQDGKMTIPTGQAFGIYNNQGLKYPMYLVGYYEEQIAEDDPETTDVDESDYYTNIEDLVFDVDEETGTMTNCSDHEQYLFVNGNAEEISYYDYFFAPTFAIYNPDAVWVAGEQGYENQQAITEITLSEGVITGTLDAAGGTAPKYVESNQTLRLYAGNTMTISSEKTMAKIIITMFSKASLEANVGELAVEGTVATWTGCADEVVFTATDQSWIQKIEIFYFDYSTTLVEAPEDLVTETYSYQGTEIDYEQDFTNTVQVGFDGDMVYIQGLSADLPEAWVRGQLKDGIVTIPDWYLGQIYISGYGYFDTKFSGAELTYDAEANKFTCEEGFSIILSSMDIKWENYANVVIELLDDVPAIPADPEIIAFNSDNNYIMFSLPTTDAEGNILNTNNLFYRFYTEVEDAVSPLTFPADLYGTEEDMSEIPYAFLSDNFFIYNGAQVVFFLQEGIDTWNKIGVQSIYVGGGETNESNIVWYTIKEEVPTGIETVGNNAETATYTDLMGRKATKATKGLVIKTVKSADGSVKSVKMMSK